MREFRFISLRQHLFRHTKTPRKHLSLDEIYRRKRDAQASRKNLANSIEGQEFYKWIEEIQKKLVLNDNEFADLIGIKIETLWKIRRAIGYFPSNKTFDRLFEIERLGKARVIVK